MKQHHIDSVFTTEWYAAMAEKLRDSALLGNITTYLVTRPHPASTEADGMVKFALPEDRRLIELQEIDVLDPGKGRGSALFYTGLAQMREKIRGNAALRLDVVSTNERTQSLYGRLGLAPSGRREWIELFKAVPNSND